MNVDQQAGLDLVDDDFGEGEHERMDEEINSVFKSIITDQNADQLVPLIFVQIVLQSGDRMDEGYQHFSNCKAISANDNIKKLILQGTQDGYKSVRLLKILRPARVRYPRYRLAHELAWEEDYVGDVADNLWAHTQECYTKCLGSNPELRSYANYSAIVQSSGMGKSRTVDEMSKSHLVIPVSLQKLTSSGYPPSDIPAYEYLISSQSGPDAFLRSCDFLDALFCKTALVLQSMQGKSVAEQFRDLMTQGMQHKKHGEKRVEFYSDVIDRLVFHSSKYNHIGIDPGKCGAVLRDSFDELCRVIRDKLQYESLASESTQKQERPLLQSESQVPLVVLAFDEVHNLAESQDRSSWSRFGELCRAIQCLRKQPIFTIFISTSLALFSVAPTSSCDVAHRRDVILPFCRLGFDQLAAHVDLSRQVTLSQVIAQEHFSSYGRPLWAPYHKSDAMRKGLVSFAVSKLLGGIEFHNQQLTLEEKFACLARRIPIEFLSAVCASQVTNVEIDQVLYHMRVILKADLEHGTVVTVSSSEPVLSEAAYCVMTWAKISLPQVLQDILREFAISKDRLENLIAALLFTIARDKETVDVDGVGYTLDNQRWCSLTGLLTSLFRGSPSSSSDDHVDVINPCGWRFTAEKTERFWRSLGETFEDSKAYFTHFIKVHEAGVVSAEFLMRLMTRGAAILCTSRSGIDGIIPFLLRGEEIRPDNIGAVMFVANNDASYTRKPDASFFLAMNPRTHGLADIPVVRIVFALAVKTPSLTFVNHDPVGQSSESYTAYDLWVTGLSSDLLGPVVADEQGIWDSILRASQHWEDIYSGEDQGVAKSMDPGAAVDKEFWEGWCEDVP